jgi:glutathione S-transferase
MGSRTIVLELVGKVPMDCEQVNLHEHRTASGVDFFTINPKGNVPCLVLDDGTVLSENSSVLQFIADQVPNKLAPSNETTERYILQDLLSFIGTGLHANIRGLLHCDITTKEPNNEALRAHYMSECLKNLQFLESNIMVGGKEHLIGDFFTVADAYLYIKLNATDRVGIDMSPFPNLQAYMKHIQNIPAVKHAIARMTLHPETVINKRNVEDEGVVMT